MQVEILNVDGMSCQHCVDSINKAVTSLPGIDSVKVDLKAKTVEVRFSQETVNLEQIKEAIEDQGFDVVG